jgi:spore coat protein U-like protein
MLRISRAIIAALFIVPAAGLAEAATTATSQFNVTMSITSQCVIANATNMAFPTTGLLASAVNQTSSFDVTCTNATPYTVGLDSGANSSSGQRRMKGGVSNTEFISYNLFSDAARSVAWGNVSGAWVSGTGSGGAQSYTVYGQVPSQTTPSAASNYLDTVTITVTY